MEELELAIQSQKKVIALNEKADYHLAIDLAVTLLEVFQKNQKWEEFIKAKSEIAFAYMALGELKLVKQILKEILELGLRFFDDEHIVIGAIYSDFGYFYAQIMGDSLTAMPYFQKALHINKKIHGHAHQSTQD
ncbi:MAG: hypothetical protein AB8B69_10835, partial [Chitinophagales bacterium]